MDENGDLASQEFAIKATAGVMFTGTIARVLIEVKRVDNSLFCI
jgi:hypothetical protein